MIVAGLDEAGYGPRLGPLVVACTAFELQEPAVPAGPRQPGGKARGRARDELARDELTRPPDLWDLLERAVAREHAARDARVWVADSKAIKPRKDGVRLLELGVLSFLASAGKLPASLPDLLGALGVDPLAAARMPWYAGLPAQRLPAQAWAGEVHTRAARLREEGTKVGVRFLGAGARVLCEDQYNARVRATDNKATVLGEACQDLLRALRAGWPGPLTVLIDKHGGRDQYTRLLGVAFPLCPIDPEEEGALLSSYRVRTPQGPVRVVFRQEAEQHGLPVALASMLAKYLREMFMLQLNAWFQARLPGLKATAGYATDADRFLLDVEAALPRLGLTREALVRTR